MAADSNYSRADLMARIILSGDELFGYNIQTRQGVFPTLMRSRYGLPERLENMPERMIELGYVAPDSVDIWRGFFAEIDGGGLYGTATLALRSEQGRYEYYKLRSSSFKDEDGQPCFAAISFENSQADYERERLHSQDVSGLIQATRKIFPELLTLNLTRGTYRIISYHGGTTLGTPREGSIDDMINIRLGGVVEEDREIFRSAASYEGLSRAFIEEGKDTVQIVYRRPGRDGGSLWFETTVTRQENEIDDDVLLVAMSRSIEAQKAEEARLRDQLYLQAEEIRVTAGNLHRTICYYDIPTRTLTVPEDYAREYHMPTVIQDYPANMDQAAESYPTDTPGILTRFCQDMIDGKPTGACEVAFYQPNRGEVWSKMEYSTIFSRGGRPLRAVIFVEDVTEHHMQARENRRLKENEQVLRIISQHSDRTVTYYDLSANTMRFWGGGQRPQRAGPFLRMGQRIAGEPHADTPHSAGGARRGAPRGGAHTRPQPGRGAPLAGP